MKGTVVGEAGEGGVPGEVVLRVTDYRGVGMDGLEWNVTLVTPPTTPDTSNTVLRSVASECLEKRRNWLPQNDLWREGIMC